MDRSRSWIFIKFHVFFFSFCLDDYNSAFIWANIIDGNYWSLSLTNYITYNFSVNDRSLSKYCVEQIKILKDSLDKWKSLLFGGMFYSTFPYYKMCFNFSPLWIVALFNHRLHRILLSSFRAVWVMMLHNLLDETFLPSSRKAIIAVRCFEKQIIHQQAFLCF